MSKAIDSILIIAWLVMWTAGMVLAHGFWSTFAAVSTGGLWSLYLVVELGLRLMGVTP